MSTHPTDKYVVVAATLNGFDAPSFRIVTRPASRGEALAALAKLNEGAHTCRQPDCSTYYRVFDAEAAQDSVMSPSK